MKNIKKLVFLIIASLFVVEGFGQKNKKVTIEFDSIKKSENVYAYTIIIKKDNKNIDYFNLQNENSIAYFKEKLMGFYKTYANKNVKISIDTSIINVKEADASINYFDLKDKGYKKLFKDKLESFYNYKEKLSKLEERVKTLENEKKSEAKIGILKFNMGKSIPIYEVSKRKAGLLFNKFQLQKTDDSIKLDSIFIHIKNGSIYEVLAISNDKTIYHANDYPITLENLLSKSNQKISKRAFEVKKMSFSSSEFNSLLNNAKNTTLTERIERILSSNSENKIDEINKIISENETNQTAEQLVIKIKNIMLDSIMNNTKKESKINILITDVKTTDDEIRLKSNKESSMKKKSINQDLRIKKRTEKRAYKVRNIKNHNEYFKLEDLVSYIPKVNSHFIPEDSVLEVKKPGIQTKTIKKSTYLNSYIESAIYTDLFSLLGDEANGLIQTEFSSKFNLNVKSLSGYYGYFFKYIKPKIKYSKFDKGFDRIEPINDTISYTKLLRQSYLDLGLQLNVFQGELGNRFESDISIGSNYYAAKINGDENNEIASNIFAIYAQTSLLVKEYHNFGLNGSLKYTKLFKPKFPNNTSASTYALNNDNNWFLTPELEMYYYPVKEKESKVFVRFQYVMNSKKDDGDFLKLQFGYKIPIKLKQK